ncbi:leucine-rich repeat domain-containing protein [Bernardetia sp. OM2101]|uniref:leucine-rich repeat domain-containing protein n=1 Tax=Bernardetia sp. OM2101 TaxID=3344876 RepID=UPI0035D0D8AA
MKKILFLIIALASMLACWFYAFDSSLFQNNEVEKKEIEEPKHQLIYDANYDFSEPLVANFSNGELEGKNEIFEYFTLCRVVDDNLVVSMHKGFMTGFDIDLTISSDSVKSKGQVGSCTYYHDYETIFSKVILSKKDVNIKDSIDIYLDMILVCYDSIENFRDTMRVKGSQRIQVREESYSQQQKMKELYMTKFIEESKQRPDTITYLDFSYIELDSLPNEIFLFKNLKELNISRSKISVEELNKLTQLKKLEKLYIENSNLEEFPSKWLEFENLKELDISNNKLKIFPKELLSFVKLEELNIGNNDISQIPTNLNKLKKLRILKIDNNNLKSVPEKLSNLINLEVLDLHGNSLSSVPTKLDDLKKLHTLKLGYNRFTNFPNVIYKMKSLRKLGISSGNKISYIRIDKIEGLEQDDYLNY